MNDRDIITLLFSRDETAVTELERKYGRFIVSIAMNVLRDRREAEEITDDILYRLWDKIPPASPDNLPAYIGKMTKALAIDRYRKETSKKRGGTLYEASLEELSEALPSKEDPETALERREITGIINKWLSSQKREVRNVFVLRYYYGDSVKAIAKATGFSGAKIKGILFRARKGLSDKLKQEGYGNEK